MNDFAQVGAGFNPDIATAADALTGSEQLVVKQNGVPVETTAQDIADLGGGGGLPDQTGNDGKFLTTDGVDAAWATVSSGGLPAGGSVGQPLVNTGDGTGDWGDDIASSPGNNLELKGADGVASTHAAADVHVEGGAAVDDTEPGGIALVYGGAATTGQGGFVNIWGGLSVDGPGGSANLYGGQSTNSIGGGANVQGGEGLTAGGVTQIAGGNADDNAGTPGDVYVQAGTNGAGTYGAIYVAGLPTSDPGNPGQIYQVAGALMISL